MSALLTILTLIILSDAIGDGLRTKGKQLAHHIVESVMYVLWGLLVIWINCNPVPGRYIVWYAVFALCIRIIFFNPVYNLVAGQSLFYLSKTSNYSDQFLAWFGQHFARFMAAGTLVGVFYHLTKM